MLAKHQRNRAGNQHPGIKFLIYILQCVKFFFSAIKIKPPQRITNFKRIPSHDEKTQNPKREGGGHKKKKKTM